MQKVTSHEQKLTSNDQKFKSNEQRAKSFTSQSAMNEGGNKVIAAAVGDIRKQI